MNFVDSLLNRITMYRLVLYYLTALVIAAVVLAFFGLVPYSPVHILFSTALALATCWVVNTLFAYVFKAQPGVESVYITAFILALIIAPIAPSNIGAAPFLLYACVAAMASKYILAFEKKHIFNPAAIGVVAVSLVLGGGATWWVAGSSARQEVVLIGGLLVVRKMQRFDMVLCCMVAAIAVITATTRGASNILAPGWEMLLYSPLFFFAFLMLTEPFTTPPTRWLRLAYGALTGVLFAPALHIGSIYSTPELALVVANLFSYAVSPKWRLMLTLKRVEQSSSSSTDFVFEPDRKVSFKPGQYLEWTLPHAHSDTRGNRRYFTIASSPTEKEVRLGVKFYPEPSTFKKALRALTPGARVSASQLAGEFTLPSGLTQKMVFIAGGIGITPFRSIVQDLLDTKQRCDIVLLYSNKTESDIAYRDIFSRAETLGLRVRYAITDGLSTMPNAVKKLDAAFIKTDVPDYQERLFYISGPHGMVTAFLKTLRELGVPSRHIKIDFFPGLV